MRLIYLKKIHFLITNKYFKKLIKFILKKNYSLIFTFKRKFYFTMPGYLKNEKVKKLQFFKKHIGKNFFLIPVYGKIIAFATGPLNDQRGIGRVTENLLNGIIDTLDLKKEFDFLPLEKKKKFEAFDLSCVDTYFFSSIHWCTDPLPKNSVIMIMDVIPLIFSDLFPKAVVKNWNVDFKKTAKNSEKIITISLSSAKDISKYLEISPNKI